MGILLAGFLPRLTLTLTLTQVPESMGILLAGFLPRAKRDESHLFRKTLADDMPSQVNPSPSPSPSPSPELCRKTLADDLPSQVRIALALTLTLTLTLRW